MIIIKLFWFCIGVQKETTWLIIAYKSAKCDTMIGTKKSLMQDGVLQEEFRSA